MGLSMYKNPFIDSIQRIGDISGKTIKSVESFGDYAVGYFCIVFDDSTRIIIRGMIFPLITDFSTADMKQCPLFFTENDILKREKLVAARRRAMDLDVEMHEKRAYEKLRKKYENDI